jgi:hypothetical protein
MLPAQATSGVAQASSEDDSEGGVIGLSSDDSSLLHILQVERGMLCYCSEIILAIFANLVDT